MFIQIKTICGYNHQKTLVHNHVAVKKDRISMKYSILALLVFTLAACHKQDVLTPNENNFLKFSTLPVTWDEGIPLGNGMLGALIWEREGNLRFSLDRADLWDLRPVENLSRPEFSFEWVQEQVKTNNYKAVQDMFDAPYDQMPAPSKIPGAALEFNLDKLGKVRTVTLDIAKARCLIEWESGMSLQTFVHADGQSGWFRFTRVPKGFAPRIIPPEYNKANDSGEESPVYGQDLRRLGYEQGSVISSSDHQVYRQKGWDGFEYEVAVNWKHTGNLFTGVWSISSTFSEQEGNLPAGKWVAEILRKPGFDQAFREHRKWWRDFWGRSSLSLPDSLLERQYYLEMYKFGSAARPDAPPISLQAVWTADNGKLPPWKGDFHHDLNTQLSYWPAYAGNHLDLEEGFLNWLWKYQDTFKKYTNTYFGTSGLNVPGVTTLTGEPMGGWIQYSFGPTVSAWLAQHFYLHWVYSGDKTFLKERAWPWIREVAVFLDEISVKDEQGMRRLPLSSSPEINDNSIHAWFSSTTNFDLAFIRWTFGKAAELAEILGEKEEARKWKTISGEWPPFALDSDGGLAFAPDYPYTESHRHFSHLVGWHPLGMIDWSNGVEEQRIIQSTLATMEKVGSDWWTGYSFSWLGNLYARALDGEKAAGALRLFAECFCLKNSFHVNGDQCKAGHSKFTYRPFTLEGNFAFASGIQEMLMQSHTGTIRVFPAVPNDWKNVGFENLRATGGFLVSAKRENGATSEIIIRAENGGDCILENPFGENDFTSGKPVKRSGQNLVISLHEGEECRIMPSVR
jgi:alpha-L-fucosidase 2